MTQTRILVTGASGTVGSAVVAALEARHIDFSVMRSHADASPGKHPVVIGDYARRETLRAAFAGFDVVFLLQPLLPDLVTHGKNAIAAAEAAGVKLLIRMSGAGADVDSPFAIGRAHGAIDQALQTSGLNWTLLRPSFFMQNHLTFNRAQIQAGRYHAAQGDGQIGLIDVRDIADSVVAVLTDLAAHRGKTYVLTGGEALSNEQQMTQLGTAAGHPVSYVDIPASAAEEAMQGMGMPPIVVEWLLSLHAIVRAGYAAGLSNDVLALTGKPPRRFADFAKEYAMAWQTPQP